MSIAQQKGFSTILFDSLFGLILFFCLDSFLEIRSFWPFVFYVFSIIILVHWWLIFKSADDAFAEEVTDSAVDLVFGVIYIILIEYIVLCAKDFRLAGVSVYLVALLAIDLIWALAWRYVGRWNTKDKNKIKNMERELDHNIKLDIIALVIFSIPLLLVGYLTPVVYIISFIVLYLLYILASFATKIIDIRIF